jgi:hypothetical protein
VALFNFPSYAVYINYPQVPVSFSLHPATMLALDLLSRSQCVAILAQIQQIASAESWLFYVELLRDILAKGSTTQSSLRQLDSFLSKHPALIHLHQMLKEELIEELPRSLPSALGQVYPWYVVSVNVANAYVTLALRRDKIMHEAKDIVAAREEVGAVLATAWSAHSTESLAEYFSRLQIDFDRTGETAAVTDDSVAMTDVWESGMEPMELV